MSKSTKKGSTAKTKAAAVETPVVEAPVVETPVAETTVAQEVITSEKKTEEKKTSEKKTETKKADKKADEKKVEAKKEIVENIYIQTNGLEILTNTLTEQVKQLWVANGHRLSTIKTLDLYVKPEEFAAYFVINGKEQGKIDF